MELQIRLFGPFQVFKQGAAVPDRAWRSQNTQGILAFLTIHGQASRERLMTAFWPDCPYKRGRANLCSTIRYVRQALNGNGICNGQHQDQDYIVYRKGLYEFHPPHAFQLDVAQFETHLERARLAIERGDLKDAQEHYQAAVTLYRGDYLQGFYYDWVDLKQEWFRDQYVKALEALAEIEYRRGQFEQVVAHCYRILEISECYEEAYRLLIQAELKLGHRGQALYLCQRVHRVLQEQFGVTPTSETQSLCRRI
ncbi:MAG: BTAD domain-containing putative transcriptional regulator [Candidatus Bipolaricaulia bacterium]